ncbi:hypothetical protein HYT84_00460 [Candidatus Micrarchaeota archaeon]|nr:hypothetical protein [Candidatus Micrarchaeota archaeon]
MNRNYMLVALVILFVLLVVVLYLFSPSTSPFKKIKSSPAAYFAPLEINECTGSESSSCNIGSCSGKKTCINGKFSECSLEIICTPGSQASCVENACANGYKTCNECGTGYSECIY